MAYTAATGFRYFRSLRATGDVPIPFPVRIANSKTIRIGDTVRVNNVGFLVPSVSSDVAAGVLIGFTDQNDIPVTGLGYNLGNTGATLTGDDTLATASDNQTRTTGYIMGQVVLDPAGTELWINKTDGALAQTNLFQYFTLDSNGRQVATGSASDSTGTVQLIMLDPESSGGGTADSTKGAFRIAGNQFGMLLDVGTAKVAA